MMKNNTADIGCIIFYFRLQYTLLYKRQSELYKTHRKPSFSLFCFVCFFFCTFDMCMYGGVLFVLC